jgi:hypothetical protein
MLNYANSIGLGFVTRVYPAGQSIDVLMSDDGSRLSNVQVMVPTGSSSTGVVDLPDPGLPSDNTRWNFNTQPERYLRAVIAFARGKTPVCLGFLLPQEGQMTFDQVNRRIERHASDVYSTTDDSGNTEWHHPSGVYFRVATSASHEDLTSQDVDKQWKIARNTTRQVHVRLQCLGGTYFDVDPNGNVTISAPSGTVSLTCPAGVTVTAPTTFDGNMTITGSVEINGALTATGDVSGGGISLMNHLTSEVQSGTGESGPPVPGT